MVFMKAEKQKLSGDDNENEWGEFLHLPGEKFYDFSKMRAEIVRDTEAKTGKNAGSGELPLLITHIDFVYSRHLTFAYQSSYLFTKRRHPHTCRPSWFNKGACGRSTERHREANP